MAERTDDIIAMAEVSGSDRILDVACGTGAEAVELASRGLCVTGLDFSSAALEIARALARGRGVSVEWICADMRELPGGDFDVVMLRDVIFGCFESHEENCRVLDSVASALGKEGRFLLEVYTKEFAVLHGLERRYVYSPDTGTFVWPDAPPGVLPIRVYSREELLGMLGCRGFQLQREKTWSWRDDPPGPPFRGWMSTWRLEDRATR